MAVFTQQLQVPQPGGVYSRIQVNQTTNSLDIFAPEPLASNIRDYIKELDDDVPNQQAQKIHVLRPKNTNSRTVEQAVQRIQGAALLKYRLQNPMMYPTYSGYRGY